MSEPKESTKPKASHDPRVPTSLVKLPKPLSNPNAPDGELPRKTTTQVINPVLTQTTLVSASAVAAPPVGPSKAPVARGAQQTPAPEAGAVPATPAADSPTEGASPVLTKATHTPAAQFQAEPSPAIAEASKSGSKVGLLVAVLGALALVAVVTAVVIISQ